MELLIAISLSSLLFGGGIISYQRFNQRQIVKNAGLAVKNNLRLAQNKALSGEKPVGFACTVLEGYEVTFSASSMDTHAKCSNGNSPSVIVVLARDVSFAPLPSPIFFKVLGEGTTGQSTITLTGFSKAYQLVVSSTGEIRDKEFVTPTPS